MFVEQASYVQVGSLGPFFYLYDRVVAPLRHAVIALDGVIDVLADWMECNVPEWMDVVRERKRQEHLAAFARYRERWG